MAFVRQESTNHCPASARLLARGNAHYPRARVSDARRGDALLVSGVIAGAVSEEERGGADCGDGEVEDVDAV